MNIYKCIIFGSVTIWNIIIGIFIFNQVKKDFMKNALKLVIFLIFLNMFYAVLAHFS